MWFSKLFKRKKNSEEAGPEKRDPADKEKAMINQGVYYLYLIIGAQIAIVLGLVTVITAFGSFIATPTWIFMAVLILGGAGIVYIYRKAKRKFQKLRQALQTVELSDRNYEISFMGGMFTMRVEQSQRPLLEAPPAAARPVIDAETVDAAPEASPR